MAVNMRGVEADVEFAGDWAIDPVQDLADNEPQERGADVAVNNRLQCDEAGNGSAGRENVNTEPRPTLGLGRFSNWHLRSLRCSPSTLHLWVRAGHRSSGAGYWCPSRMEDYAPPWSGNSLNNMA